MAQYAVQFSKRADREMTRLPPLLRERVTRAIALLGDDPRPPNVKQLVNWQERTYRIRIGDLRVLYEVHDSDLLVMVMRVLGRDDAHRVREHEEPYHLESAATA